VSELGKSEMRRWEREGRALFPWLPTITITDDGVTPGHAVTSVLPDRTLQVALAPEMVPGHAVGLHEICHCVQRTLQLRVDDMLALVQEAFAVRGVSVTVTAANLPLAFEQMASMLPEAFIGEWGGYDHPLYGMDPAARDPQVTAYFNSPAAAKVREWFLALATWRPSVPAGGVVAPPVFATPAGPTALPAIANVYYSQWDPDHVGSGDCVPTSAKMLIELYTGRVVPIGEIRTAMDLGDNGVIDLARGAGITLEAARAALTNDYGIPSTAVFSRHLDVDQLLDYVRAGRLPIVFELHGALIQRMDGAFTGLHAVLVTGVVDGETVEIKDPDRWGPSRGERWTVPLEEFRSAWEGGVWMGGGAVIPNEPRGGEMDRNTFNAWFREQYLATIDPTIESMKRAYNPCVVYMRDNGLLDAAQEQEIREALARLDKLKTI
jgi:hypothetical protein